MKAKRLPELFSSITASVGPAEHLRGFKKAPNKRVNAGKAFCLRESLAASLLQKNEGVRFLPGSISLRVLNEVYPRH